MKRRLYRFLISLKNRYYSHMNQFKRILRHSVKTLSLPKYSAIINNDIFGASNNSDIAEHLSTLYNICLAKMPKSVLELGTRGGESTRVLVEYCEKFGVLGRSIDLEPSPNWLPAKKWSHFVGDDIVIGKSVLRDKKWPDGIEFNPVDLIFLDSSHEYLHTLEELMLYWPLIAEGGVLVLHDTNLTEQVTRKLSGEANIGWNNEQGVSRAIQEYFGLEIEWNELTSFNFKTQNIGIRGMVHFPWNNGFTCIYK